MGLWTGNGGRLAINPNSYEPNATRNAPIHIDDVPIQDWAKALTNFRHINVLADEPHTRCKPSAGPRQFVTPYGIEILDVPEEKRIYIIDVGGPHTFRTIYMDGRPHPSDLAEHTWDGFSTGKVEGNKLTITTTHMKYGVIQRNGVPASPYAVMTEHFIRHGDFLTLVTIVDEIGRAHV